MGENTVKLIKTAIFIIIPNSLKQNCVEEDHTSIRTELVNHLFDFAVSVVFNPLVHILNCTAVELSPKGVCTIVSCVYIKKTLLGLNTGRLVYPN